ncbi:MAG: hypothetical protein AAGF97_05665 [Planctomycetota bacterium]
MIASAFSLRGLFMLVVGIALGLAMARTSQPLRPRVVASEGFAFALPEYQIEPPDVVAIHATNASGETIVQDHYLVGPDGNVQMGEHAVTLAGLTVTASTQAVREALGDGARVTLRVADHNSKVVYLISHSNGADLVHRIPFTGKENVLDALSHLQEGRVASDHIWIARPTADPSRPAIITVDFEAITKAAQLEQNYQLLPGDRIFVSSRPPAATSF